MAGEFLVHVLLEAIAYPILYAVGFVVVKTCTLGRAHLLSLTDSAHEKEMRWYQFFVRRSGLRFWTPEAIMLVGGCFSLLLAATAYFLWR